MSDDLRVVDNQKNSMAMLITYREECSYITESYQQLRG
jgi:hypothetical protein